MFQKLYRHLEDVNATLRRQEEAIHTNTAYGKDIVRQLESMNENAKIGLQYLSRTSKRYPAVYPASFLLLLVLTVGALALLNIRLSGITTEIAGSQRAAKQEIQADLLKARSIEYVMGRQQEMADQLIQLDSIISRQGQSLLELKDLNTASSRAFRQIKRKIDQTNRLIRLLKVDSGVDVGAVKAQVAALHEPEPGKTAPCAIECQE